MRSRNFGSSFFFRPARTARIAIVLALSMLPGCFGEALGDAIGDVATSIGCAFDFDFHSPITSDNGQLRAILQCEPGADCADRRTVIVGSQFDFTIEIPMHRANGPVRVLSTDPSVIELTGYERTSDPCDGTVQIDGTVSFPAVGTAAVVVEVGGTEIDRFTASAHEAARLDVQAAPFAGVFTGNYETVRSVALDKLIGLRAIVRNGAGDRLVGAKDFGWSVEDESIAQFLDQADTDAGTTVGVGTSASRHPSFFPVAIGTTTLHVEAHGVSMSIPIEVTSLPDPDAGIVFDLSGDASIEEIDTTDGGAPNE